MSDGKGPTVTLFKIKENGQCVGGFTSAQWASHESCTFVSDHTAIVFNLTTRKLFKCQDHSKAILCWKERGPVFGDREIGAKEPFNGFNQCYSYAQDVAYNIPMDNNGISSLTNLKIEKLGGGFFTSIQKPLYE